MSYARFSGYSDVYIFSHAGGFIQCCGCRLVDLDEGEIFGFANLKTAREALQHLDRHVLEGDKVPTDTFRRIREDNPDLDAEIPPYVPSPESVKRTKEIMRKFLKG
jgi:hypothetical protein